MDTNLNTQGASKSEELRQLDPKECEYSIPYMVDNGVLDIYICKKFGGHCYFEPNGGKQFKKMCE